MSPTIVCTLDCEMAGAVPPNYKYSKIDSLSSGSDTLTIFCSNARNAKDLKIVPELPLLQPIVNKLYEGREEITPDLGVAKNHTCPSVGEIQYLTEKNMTFAVIITNVLDKPLNSSSRQRMTKRMTHSPELNSENFKFKLRADNVHVRDYYFMSGLEKIINYCKNHPNIKKVQLIWPHVTGKYEAGKRMRNTVSHLTHFGYALWQKGISLFVFDQPDLSLEDIDLCCNAAALEAESKVVASNLNLELIKKEQIKDEDLSKIINDLVKSSLQAEDYWYDQEILFKIDSSASREDTARVCIPKSLVKSVLEVFHDQCAHPGTGKTYLLTKSQVHWINMMSDIQRYVAKCLRCVQAKNSVNRRVMSGHLVLPPHAGHTYAIDILGSLPAANGCNQILILVCTFGSYRAIRLK